MFILCLYCFVEFSQGMILPAKDKHTEIKASVNGSVQVSHNSHTLVHRNIMLSRGQVNANF